MFKVAIKSGTSGHYSRDDCDLVLAEIPSDNIPSVGDILKLDNHKKYLVREVNRTYNLPTDKSSFKEWIYVYVIAV